MINPDLCKKPPKQLINVIELDSQFSEIRRIPVSPPVGQFILILSILPFLRDGFDRALLEIFLFNPHGLIWLNPVFSIQERRLDWK